MCQTLSGTRHVSNRVSDKFPYLIHGFTPPILRSLPAIHFEGVSFGEISGKRGRIFRGRRESRVKEPNSLSVLARIAPRVRNKFSRKTRSGRSWEGRCNVRERGGSEVALMEQTSSTSCCFISSLTRVGEKLVVKLVWNALNATGIYEYCRYPLNNPASISSSSKFSKQ